MKTPVDEMTDEELRIEIAEFCGTLGTHWKKLPNGNWDRNGHEISTAFMLKSNEFPNYPSSLDAMWEAEELLMSNYRLYIGHIVYILKAGEFAVHATAKQRAIAFVKTIREIKK
jgi:hypothetical protein